MLEHQIAVNTHLFQAHYKNVLYDRASLLKKTTMLKKLKQQHGRSEMGSSVCKLHYCQKNSTVHPGVL
jgi:hypothetical protein